MLSHAKHKERGKMVNEIRQGRPCPVLKNQNNGKGINGCALCCGIYMYAAITRPAPCPERGQSLHTPSNTHCNLFLN